VVFLKLISAAKLSIKAKLNKRNNPSENTRKIGRLMFPPMVRKVRPLMYAGRLLDAQLNLRNTSGSLAIFAAIRRALAAPGHERIQI
jgi:hypothetical protein